MGPFPHDAPRAEISAANPMGTDGFEFVEFAAPDPAALNTVFALLGFTAVARHRSKNVTLWRQGDVNFLVNAEAESFASGFAALHGPCACAMAFRVADARHALDRAVALGARPLASAAGPMELNIPAIEGIGGSQLYLVDRYGERGSIWDVDFVWTGARDPRPEGAGLHYIDHLTHNVRRGNMDVWAGWYEKLFGFREVRFFAIEGKLTGLVSRAMVSPEGRIRIPINESADDKSQIEEFLSAYRGEGIQHVAMGTEDIFATVAALRAAGVPFMPAPPATYYEMIPDRLPAHGESIEKLQALGILMDGEATLGTDRPKLLLQIFTGNLVGPIFFEIIQRKGDEGFGEGNFRALFESIEADQVRRGVLKPRAA
jgi:4-hydroxyphenylpyruvate dioxygenase